MTQQQNQPQLPDGVILTPAVLLAETLTNETAFEAVPEGEAHFAWVMVLPESELVLDELEDGRQVIATITPSYIQRVHEEHERYLRKLGELGNDLTTRQGKRPIISRHNTWTDEEFGWIDKTAVRPLTAGSDKVGLWVKLGITKPLPTRNLSVGIYPDYLVDHMIETFNPFLHHVGTTAFPRFLNVSIPDDPAVWEAVGLEMSERNPMTTNATPQNTPATNTTQMPTPTTLAPPVQASAPTPAPAPVPVPAPAVPPAAAPAPAPSAPVLASEQSQSEVIDQARMLVVLNKFADKLEAQDRQIAALQEQLAGVVGGAPGAPLEASESNPPASPMDELFQRIEAMEVNHERQKRAAVLPTREQGSSGQAVPTPMGMQQSVIAAERALQERGVSFHASDVATLSRRFRGETLSQVQSDRLANLGV